MTERGGGRLSRRLRRILLLLPYAIRHPGVTIAELSARFAVDERELIEDLNLVFVCGLPGYGPGDLIDVTIEEDRVYVGMADYFAAPLRITPVEALSLYAGAAAVAELPDMKEADALKRAIAKLGRALGVQGGVDVRLERSPDQHLRALQRALAAGRRISMEYFSASRGEMTERAVDPWGLITALGRWYLVGWDHLAEDERMFRVDRIKSIALTEEHADVPTDFDPARYKGGFAGDRADGLLVTLEVSTAVARWFGDYYPVMEERPLDDGWRRVTLSASSARWAADLLLRLGSGARRVEPPSVVADARSTARAIAARYAQRGSAGDQGR